MDQQQDALRRLGARLTRLRQQNDLSLAQLSTRSGVSTGDITAIEAGELDPTITIIHALAQGLGLSPSELLSLE